jgi:hypothetical protein
VHKVIRHYFPRLFEQMNNLADARKRRDYAVSELVTGCMAMFLFKETSRNALNLDRREDNFKENYYRVFKLRLPHMDTVEAFLRLLKEEGLEELKAALVAGMVEQKVFNRFKFLGKYFTVAIDGTGTNSYSQNDTAGSRIHKTSKNGVTVYGYHVVEAKLVTSSGLSISLASEWVTNETGRNFDKQDCEQEAFVRLAKKLKKYFPRLPVCLLADGLYPNKTFMQTCRDNGWAYVVVLKDNSLKILQQDIGDTENKHRHTMEVLRMEHRGKTHIHQQYQWIEMPFMHAGHAVYRLSCTETVTCYGKDKKPLQKQPGPVTFVWLSSQKPTRQNVQQLAEAGRNRWKIENEGFNAQKNGGYALGHKYSRKSFTSYKNYYQCMQVAHLINQLAEHSSVITSMLDANTKLTVKHLWKQLVCWFLFDMAGENEFDTGMPRCQIRLRHNPLKA